MKVTKVEGVILRYVEDEGRQDSTFKTTLLSSVISQPFVTMRLNNEDEILLLIDEDRLDSHERVTEVAFDVSIDVIEDEAYGTMTLGLPFFTGIEIFDSEGIFDVV